MKEITVQEMQKIPARARVAFAARCARRLQPALETAWKNAPSKALLLLEEAISRAEAFTSNDALSQSEIQAPDKCGTPD